MKKWFAWLLVLVLSLPLAGALAEESFTLLVDDAGVLEDKVMYPILEEQTGITVNAQLLPYEAALERKNILLSSGDYPDVIGGWLLSESDILNDGMIEGLYIPIEDYIAEYSPRMQEILEIPGVRDTMTLPDGHIYTIPYVIEEPLVTFIPWINHEWLENVNMEMPATTEELREVLRAFKEQDANGNGDPNDEIPFSGDPNNQPFGRLAGWFGVNAHNSGEHPYYAMVGDKIVFQGATDNYKEMIKYFASLYAEGLIDETIFTQDLETWKSIGKQGLYGVCVAYGPGDFFDLEPATQAGPYSALPVLSSEYTDTPLYRRASYGVTTFRTQVAITDKAEDPGMIIRWFDNVFAPDNSIQIQHGFYGVKLEKLEDGQYRRLDESKLTEEERAKYDWSNMFTQSLPKYIPVGLKILPAEGVPERIEYNDINDELYGPYLEEKMIPRYWMNAEDAERVGILQTDIRSYCDQKMAEWISGEKDIEAEWDAYLAKLEEMGLSELTEIKQNAIDSIPTN